MSAIISVEVKYAEKLVDNLRETFPDAVDTGVVEAVQTVSERMLQTANRLVPVRTGFLKSSIVLEETGRWMFRLVARAPYASYVEWGTSRMAARLFMTQAVEFHKPEMWEQVENAVAEAVRSAFT
jgi:HK97 gp10 family phage protein